MRRYGWSSFAGWVRGVWVGEEVWMEQFCWMNERSVGR